MLKKELAERILDYSGIVQWKNVDKDFEKRVKEKGMDNFYPAWGEVICCGDCARGNPKHTNYGFYVGECEPGDSSKYFEVPRENDRGDLIVAYFEFQGNTLQGWVSPAKYKQFNKRELEKHRKMFQELILEIPQEYKLFREKKMQELKERLEKKFGKID